jgi:vitamin K-dependent gamma-carboxylase
LTRLTERALRPVSGASLAAFRIVFGLLMAFSMTRFLLNGWIDEVLVEPTYFFKYPGFEWVPVPGPTALYTLGIIVAIAALGIAAGLFYRVSVFVFLVGFGWLQLMDLTNYLNHYYLAWLLGLWCLILPLHRTFSVDARRKNWTQLAQPAWFIWALRFQLAVVYFSAGVAKINADWLLHGQPMGIWMTSRADLPVIGSLVSAWPMGMSWAGCLYDLTIAGWLLWPRTRSLAYVGVLVFHVVTQALFNIGMFPAIMITSTLIFFDADWPRRLLRRAPQRIEAPAFRRPARPLIAGLLIFALFQVSFPHRCHLIGDNVLWDEVGMRWSWRVMLREKMGSITYRVERPNGREKHVNPKTYLTWRQWAEMSGQPGMIVQLAHHIADEQTPPGGARPAVRVDALVSLNGRRAALLIDPKVDLTRLDGRTDWILSAPPSPPLRIVSRPDIR